MRSPSHPPHLPKIRKISKFKVSTVSTRRPKWFSAMAKTRARPVMYGHLASRSKFWPRASSHSRHILISFAAMVYIMMQRGTISLSATHSKTWSKACFSMKSAPDWLCPKFLSMSGWIKQIEHRIQHSNWRTSFVNCKVSNKTPNGRRYGLIEPLD